VLFVLPRFSPTSSTHLALLFHRFAHRILGGRGWCAKDVRQFFFELGDYIFKAGGLTELRCSKLID